MANDLITTTSSPLATTFTRLAECKGRPTEAECLAVVKAINADAKPAGTERANAATKTIMGFYPRADFDDPQTYVLGVVAVMAGYPAGVLRRVSDPRTGIAGRLKFLPRIAEIREACDAEMKLRVDVRKRAGFVIWKRRIEGMIEGDRRRLLLLEESMALVGLCRNEDSMGGVPYAESYWKLIPSDDEDDDEQLNDDERNRRKRNRELVAGLISSIG